jgi:epoxyqueuosine reductase
MAKLPPRPKRPPKPATPRELRDAIAAKALELGFDAVAFAPAQLSAEARQLRRERMEAFLAHGFQGDMGWLVDRAEQRIDPAGLWPEARTVVSVALNYGPANDPRFALEERERGTVSVYAQGRDYHDVMKSRLKQLGRFIWDTYHESLKVFVDTAPLMEKLAAQQAGHGWQGKHTNLVSRRFGSWLFLGELLLSVELPPDEAETDHCGQCRACLDACPTYAFPAPYQLDARRCISYLTIEHAGPIDREFRTALGNRIYGCDDCLAACPWNKFARQSREAAFAPRAELRAPLLAELATLDDATFRTRFSGTSVKRIGRDRFLRNVAYALGNSAAPATALPAVERLLTDASPLVRGAAVWALSQLAPDEFERRQMSTLDEDSSVLAEWQRTKDPSLRSG